MTVAIALDNVSIALGGRTILDRISLEVPAGGFLSVVGASGSGKTTLLRLIAGLYLPTSGAVVVQGQNVTGPSQHVAIVFQDYGRALLPWRTASGNVSLALEAKRTPRSERADIIAALLAKVGLAQHHDKYPNQLSGGMQQRLQIARALAQGGSVLLMDEPFGALDALTRQSLQDEVLKLASDTGATIVFITHDLEEALYLGDRVVALGSNPGRIERSADIDLARPRGQLTTREHPRFLALRRELFAFIEAQHA